MVREFFFQSNKQGGSLPYFYPSLKQQAQTDAIDLVLKPYMPNYGTRY